MRTFSYKRIKQLMSNENDKWYPAVDYGGKPLLSFEELLSLFSEDTVVVLDEILANKTTWTTVYQCIWDIMKYGFGNDGVQENILHFKFHTSDKKVHALQLRHFLSNMIFWYAFAVTDSVDVLDESFIFNFKGKSQEDINRYIDDKIVRVISVDSETKSTICDEIVYHISAVAKYISILAGPGISIYNIWKTARQNPEIEDIMFNKLPAGLQPNEVEHLLKEKSERLIDILCKTDCDLAPIFNAGNIMSKGQFQEVMVEYGFKSDLNGNVIPYPVKANVLTDGIRTPADFFVIAASSRKSAIFMKMMMGIPGAYSKRVTYNTLKVQLRKDYDMCDSVLRVNYTIHDDEELKLLNGRYYYDEDGKMKCCDGFKDKHLIGKTLPFRSPVTCNSKEGVCKYCYGELFDINNDLASAGSYGATIETEPLGQRVLKTKHIDQTDSNLIEFNEEFNRDFELVTTDIILKNNTDDNDSAYIIFDELNKERVAGYDEPQYYCYSYSVLDINKKTLYSVSVADKTKLYLSGTLVTKFGKSISKDMCIISFDDLADVLETDVLFKVETKSAGSMDATTRIKDLINKKTLDGCKTIDEMCQRYLELKIKSNIKFDAVHDEMIIRGLIRKRSNIYEFPDFGPNGDLDDYRILSVGESRYNTGSPLEALISPYLKRQLLDPSYFTKTAPSPMDPLFAPVLYDILPPDSPFVDKSNKS